jgi:hypothetical protein
MQDWERSLQRFTQATITRATDIVCEYREYAPVLATFRKVCEEVQPKKLTRIDRKGSEAFGECFENGCTKKSECAVRKGEEIIWICLEHAHPQNCECENLTCWYQRKQN